MVLNNKWYKTWWAVVIWVFIGLIFLPFTIGGLLIYFVLKNVKSFIIKAALILIIGIPALFIGSDWIKSWTTSNVPKQEIVNRQQKQEVGKLKEYKITERKLSEQVVGENLNDAYAESLKKEPAKDKELVLRVVVPSDTNEADLKFTINYIINEETSKDKDIDEITVFVYDREQDVNNTSYTVARAIWAPEGILGKITKEIAKNNNRGNYKINWSIKSRILTKNTFSTGQETEMYYRYREIYHEITEKEGTDPLPKIGEKNASFPKMDKAKQLAAKEFNISTSELQKILDRVSKSKPSEEEMKIFQTYDDRLNKAIDTESNGGEKIDEDKIKKEIANLLNITPEKLSYIWDRVFMWQQGE